jgi:hypothetical protein
MRPTEVEIELQIDELLKGLDADAQHLQDSLSLLHELRALVIKRDEVALRRLLKTIQIRPKGIATGASQCESARERLAKLLGWEVGETTLSRIETVVSGKLRLDIAQRKARLMSLTESLRTEYSRTAMLLSECARFNRLLLDNILQSGRATGVTYTPDGTTKQQSQTAFVNMQI